MAKFCNQFDRVCAELGAAVVYCHHHSKGDQGQKRASDRASGSGVFARDPDALIDMIELEVTEGIQNTYVARRECDSIAEALDLDAFGWRGECPEDDALVVDKLVKWAESQGFGEIVRRVRPEVRAQALEATGWRIEGILREFRPFKPRQIWFAYPCHKIDDNDVLADAKAAGELPQRRSRDEAIEAERMILIENYKGAFSEVKKNNKGRSVKVKQMAKQLEVTEKTVRANINKYGDEMDLEFDKGEVFEASENEENDEK